MPETFSTSLTISLQLFASGVGDAALNLVSRSKNDGIVVWGYAHMEKPTRNRFLWSETTETDTRGRNNCNDSKTHGLGTKSA